MNTEYFTVRGVIDGEVKQFRRDQLNEIDITKYVFIYTHPSTKKSNEFLTLEEYEIYKQSLNKR